MRIRILIFIQIDNYETLLSVINQIIQRSPCFGSAGPPIYMALAQAMNTREGINTFLHSELNKRFKAMFKTWTEFLLSKESRYVLNTDEGGWFSAPALRALEASFGGMNFFDIYDCENTPENYYGYDSFDHFFNRHLRQGVRPLMFPDNPDIINAACESKVYNIVSNVKRSDSFWLKGEPYSLQHMLHGEYVEEFAGGTVFQGFVEVSGYHRWHSPVTGTIEKILNIEGAYFAQSPAVLDSDYYSSSPAAPGPDLETNPYLRSLGFLTAIATRTLFFIRSDNPKIGLMCFITIGMTEVSTCVIHEHVREGLRVKKGDELGMFRFGGSSHVLVFGPNAKVTFFDENNKPGQYVKVRAAIAGVH